MLTKQEARERIFEIVAKMAHERSLVFDTAVDITNNIANDPELAKG